MSYSISYTNRFKKSYKRCIKRGYDASLFQNVVSILSEKGTLPPEYHPHKLSGNYNGYWECHIQPDWLMIWEQQDQHLTLLLIDTGSHADLFG